MKRLVFCAVCVILLVASLGAENVNTVTPKAGVSINERAGTFSVYLISAKGQRVALFDESSGLTGFSLKTDKATYPLLGGAGITTKASSAQDGGSITYSIAKVADVSVSFAFAASTVGRPSDILRVDVAVLNKSGKTQNFEISGLFDTILGESDASFFSTASQKAISKEYLIRDLAPHLWVRGTDNDNSMRFLLYGDGITSPQSVTLANLDRMASLMGGEEVSPDRNFSPDNVAVGIKWEPMQLQKDQTGGITFYLFLGSGETPSPSFLTALAKERPAMEAPPAGAGATRGRSAAPGGGTYLPPPTPTPDNEAPRPKYPQAPAPQAPSPPVVVYIRPPTPPVVNTGNSADADYARDLFDRIQKLGSGPGGVNGINRDEIIRLNAELDKFLARIGQKG